MPCYLKSHSRGEYVFDWGWADAIERVGGRYYPKLQASVPFTPVTGPRLLVPPGERRDSRRKLLAEASLSLAEQPAPPRCTSPSSPSPNGQLSTHDSWLKRTDTPVPLAQSRLCGFRRLPQGALLPQAQEHPQGARHRRRERPRRPLADRADDRRGRHWDAFFRFYMDTGSRKWGSPYLTRGSSR